MAGSMVAITILNSRSIRGVCMSGNGNGSTDASNTSRGSIRSSCSIPSVTASPTFRERESDLLTRHTRMDDRNRTRHLGTVFAALVLSVTTTANATGLAQLKAFVDGAKTGRSTFRQAVVPKGRDQAQVSSGTFS